ncbi:MAG: hypothetical protein C4583_13900 [Anaerolineaceae bacterium]|nr:MAG: hypothetical protein C4583_13900 [Anaerolineaceae bacterium]
MSSAVDSPKSEKLVQPYPPSFVDRLMAWIERLPGSAWGFYLLASVIFVALGHGLRWLDGSIETGTFDPFRLITDFLTIYALAILHLLNSTARRSLEEFRSALGKPEAEYEKLRYELTTLSPRFVYIMTGIALPFAALSIAGDPAGWGIMDDSSLVTNVFSALQATLSTVSFIGLISNAIRQLRLINTIHKSANNISLYESHSHHAFSRLTVRAAIALVFPIYFYSFVVFLQIGRLGTMSAVDNLLVLFVILISAAVFILPLLGMRRRLLDEKGRLINESNRKFEATARILHERVEAEEFEKTGVLQSTMTSLLLERETLKKISTWPWEAETMRGFLSSVGLPILLWFITTYLGRFFQ